MCPAEPRPAGELLQPAPAGQGFPRPVKLLFGLPLTLEDFLARLDDEPLHRGDFLTKYDDPDRPAEERRAARLRWWSSRYELNVAKPLRELASAATALGCDVRERAILADVSAAAREDSVVIVVSHWKGPEFSNDDFLADFAEALEARLAAVDHPLATAILQSMRPRRGWLPFMGSKPLGARAAIRLGLDVAIADTPTAADSHYELPTTGLARRRALLDKWLHGLILPGNQLELFDGLHAADAVSPAISTEFTGVLDLTICTSTWLGDHLGRAAAQRFRTVQFTEPQDFLDASIRIRQALTVFAEGELSYLAARQVVNEAYIKVVDELMASMTGEKHGR